MSEQAAEAKPQGLTEILDEQLEDTKGQEKVTLGDMLDSVGQSSYGPLLLIPSLVALSPIGMIPGFSIITGTIIILVAVQILIGLPHPWLPKRMLAYSFSRERLESFVRNFRSWTRWIDGFISPRWTFLTRPPFVQMLALIFIGLAVTFYPLALIPFGVAVPSAAASLLALALTARDGVLVLVSLVLTSASVWLLLAFWPF